MSSHDSNFPRNSLINDHPTAALADKLIHRIAALDRVVVAFSGGVDSSVVAAAAFRALPENSFAVTAISPSVASWQRETATEIAALIGIDHQWIETDEVDLDDYRRNDAQRCFHCKKTLYGSIKSFTGTSIDGAMQSIRSALAGATILSGTNADDLGDYRPGLKAGSDAGVQTPLADLNIGKADVRKLATHFGLSNNDLPASPCLASRIAYGIEVTPQRLKKIDQCESWLRSRGFDDVRVRLLNNDEQEIARVEVPLPDLPRLIEQTSPMTSEFLSLGFDQVVVDPAGLRSGNLNEALVELVSPQRPRIQQPRSQQPSVRKTPQ